MNVIGDIVTYRNQSIPINLEMLLANLKYIGFSDCALGWIRVYSFGRVQRLNINNIYHLAVKESCGGGLQRITLGTLVQLISLCACHCYADTFKMYASIHSNYVVSDIFNHNNDLSEIQSYCKDHDQ